MTTALNPSDHHDSLRQGEEQYWDYLTAPEDIRNNAETVVLIVRSVDLVQQGKHGTYRLLSKPLCERRNSWKKPWADDFPFREALSTHALGTGFFIRRDLILTAAHIVFSPRENLALQDLRFIRTFIGKEKPLEITPEQVFRPTKTATESLKHQISRTGADWALIEVEPLVEEAATTVLPQFSEQTPQYGQAVYAIGHGFGLGLKINQITANILVNDMRQPYFECNLPLLVSSSGSPVFCAKTHCLLGMLIRAADQLRVKDDKVSVLQQVSVYEGQECQRLNHLYQYLNAA